MSAARDFERRGAGLSQWQYDADRGRPQRTNNVISPVVTQWEREHSPAWRKQVRAATGSLSEPVSDADAAADGYDDDEVLDEPAPRR